MKLFCNIFTALLPSSWPDGPYILPMTKYGCPEPPQYGWTQGYINITSHEPLHMFMSKNNTNGWPISEDINIIGPFGTNSFQLNFCMKLKQYPNHSISDTINGSEAMSSDKWPDGNYSVFSVDKECPKGVYIYLKVCKTNWEMGVGYKNIPYLVRWLVLRLAIL